MSYILKGITAKASDYQYGVMTTAVYEDIEQIPGAKETYQSLIAMNIRGSYYCKNLISQKLVQGKEVTADTATVTGTMSAETGTFKNITCTTISGDLTGNVTGNLEGNVKGSVEGDVTGNLTGNVKGDVIGNLEGNVTGNLTGDVQGDVIGNLKGDVEGNVTGNLTGDVQGNITGDTCTFNTSSLGSVTADTLTVTNDLTVKGTSFATAYQATSDLRLKTDLKALNNAIETISKLGGYTYTLKDEKQRRGGLIAQEVESVFPEAVRTDSKGYKSIDYNAIIALLVNAIKELK